MLKYITLILSFVFCCCISIAQKPDSIYFHLYTDSLKKGVHNYINVDGKLPNGRYLPLSSKEIEFSSNAGKWEGNNLIVDSSYNKDSVAVTAVLKKKPEVKKSIIIYMKKNLSNEQLKTEQELMNEWQNKKKKRG